MRRQISIPISKSHLSCNFREQKSVCILSRLLEGSQRNCIPPYAQRVLEECVSCLCCNHTTLLLQSTSSCMSYTHKPFQLLLHVFLLFYLAKAQKELHFTLKRGTKECILSTRNKTRRLPVVGSISRLSPLKTVSFVSSSSCLDKSVFGI